MVTLDRPLNRFTANVPLYIQIAEGLLDRIESGELSPGDRLPSERDLSQRLGVNRMTLRRALEMLESQGLLLRRQGNGTYVAEPKIERQAGKLVPFTRGMQRRGYLPGARVILFEKRPAEAVIAKELGLPVSTVVYYVRRLRLINQEPVMLESLAVPARRFPELERFDLSRRSVYEVMEKEYGVVVVRARQSLEPVVAAEYEAELLGVKPGDPLMLERRLGFDQQDRPVEYGKDLYRGDRFRFVTEIAPLEL
jgi:GntR family transcriptional regulator